jgi:hypothetical protein
VAQLVYIESEYGTVAEVEINVDIRFGYPVTTEAVFEGGVAEIGKTRGLQDYQEGTGAAPSTGVPKVASRRLATSGKSARPN